MTHSQKACTANIRWQQKLFDEVQVRSAIVGLTLYSAGNDYFALLCVLQFHVDLGIRFENSLACQGKGLPGYAGIRRVIENKIGLALSDCLHGPYIVPSRYYANKMRLRDRRRRNGVETPQRAHHHIVPYTIEPLLHLAVMYAPAADGTGRCNARSK